MIDIWKFREKHRVTQRKLAFLCGVSLMTIQNWEAGITTPNEDNFEKLKKVITAVENERMDKVTP